MKTQKDILKLIDEFRTFVVNATADKHHMNFDDQEFLEAALQVFFLSREINERE